jgi:hypothetical protein
MSPDPGSAQRGQADAAQGSSRSQASHSNRSPLAPWHRKQSCASKACLILTKTGLNGRDEIDKRKCFLEDASGTDD